MTNVLIRDNNKNIVLFLNEHYYAGYAFDRNKVEEVDDSVFNYFNFLKLSKNNTQLPDEYGYKVILDKDTNYKHYFKDNQENLRLFFDHNGENVTLYENNDINNTSKGYSKIKKFNKTMFTIDAILILACAVYLIKPLHRANFINMWHNVPVAKEALKNDVFNDLTKEDIKDWIYSSTLEDKDKDLLYNEKFFDDVLPYINKIDYSKFMYKHKFDDINIKYFNDKTDADTYGYYHQVGDMNAIHICNSIKNEDSKIRTRVLSHEFMHLCQTRHEYKLLNEASADLLAKEYFNIDRLTYGRGVKALQKLTYIIGKEPIMEYLYADNFESIEKNVKPYLSDEEYQKFLEGCNCDIAYTKYDGKYSYYTKISDELKQFNSLLDTLAKNKGMEIENQEIYNQNYFNTADTHVLSK